MIQEACTVDHILRSGVSRKSMSQGARCSYTWPPCVVVKLLRNTTDEEHQPLMPGSVLFCSGCSSALCDVFHYWSMFSVRSWQMNTLLTIRVRASVSPIRHLFRVDHGLDAGPSSEEDSSLLSNSLLGFCHNSDLSIGVGSLL